VYGHKIAVGQQAGAKLEIVFEIKRPAGLKLCAEGRQGHRLGQLLDAPDRAELLLLVLLLLLLLLLVLRHGQPRGSTVAPTMVAVDGGGRRGRWMLLVGGVLVVGGHADWRWTGSAALRRMRRQNSTVGCGGGDGGGQAGGRWAMPGVCAGADSAAECAVLRARDVSKQ